MYKININYEGNYIDERLITSDMIIGTKSEISRLYRDMYSRWENDKLDILRPCCLGLPEYSEHRRFYGILIEGEFNCHKWQETFSIINSDTITGILYEKEAV